MSNRIDATFQRLRAARQSAFIAYITAGDPNLAATLEVAHALERAGVDLVELGIPFSDPLADGPTIQAASGRALASGTTVAKVLKCVRKLREASEIPVVLFTYLNPVYSYGFERFHVDAAGAGADGVLVLDLPPEEAKANRELARVYELKTIRLIAPTTPPARMQAITDAAEGFIYYVSREGVTGEQASLAETIVPHVEELRRHTVLPIAVGFGISTPEQAAQIAKCADAVVVGSAIVRCIAEHSAAPDLVARVEAFVRPLAAAIHGCQRLTPCHAARK